MAFGGAHLVLSSQPVRARLVGRLGLWAFQALYSLIVLALFVPLVDVYFAHKHDGVVLWAFPPSPVLRWIAYVGIALAFVLVVGSQVTPSPANIVLARRVCEGSCASHGIRSSWAPRSGRSSI